MLSLNRDIFFTENQLVSILGSVHAIVDMCCAVFVVSLINIYPLKNNEYIAMLIVYNVFAFGLQPLIGFVADRFLNTKWYTLMGVGLTAAAIFFTFKSPWIVVILAGTGNASFHIGGGVAALTVGSKKVAPSGWFVAPGALGLALGIYLGKKGVPLIWPYVVLLVFSLIAIRAIKFPVKPDLTYQKINDINKPYIIAGLLLISVAVRSFVGFQSGGVWKGSRIAMWVIPCSIACGKIFGGIIADRIGMFKTGTLALIMSFILLSIWPSNQWISLCGLMFLQMTMPITLVALFNVIPGKPGVAFGLCCLALIIGAVPAITSYSLNIGSEIVVSAGLVISIFSFYIALKLLVRRQYDNTMVKVSSINLELTKS